MQIKKTVAIGSREQSLVLLRTLHSGSFRGFIAIHDTTLEAPACGGTHSYGPTPNPKIRCHSRRASIICRADDLQVGAAQLSLGSGKAVICTGPRAHKEEKGTFDSLRQIRGYPRRSAHHNH
jgi:hypothetical protein